VNVPITFFDELQRKAKPLPFEWSQVPDPPGSQLRTALLACTVANEEEMEGVAELATYLCGTCLATWK
jgi:hypothetical protein